MLQIDVRWSWEHTFVMCQLCIPPSVLLSNSALRIRYGLIGNGGAVPHAQL